MNFPRGSQAKKMQLVVKGWKFTDQRKFQKKQKEILTVTRHGNWSFITINDINLFFIYSFGRFKRDIKTQESRNNFIERETLRIYPTNGQLGTVRVGSIGFFKPSISFECGTQVTVLSYVLLRVTASKRLLIDSKNSRLSIQFSNTYTLHW